MANIPPNRSPSPDPRYPFIGPNYQKHGELQGYLYNPYTDKYRVDPVAAENAGLKPKTKSPPGTGQILGAVAGGAAALAAGKLVGEKGVGYLGDKVGSIFGGEAAKQTGTGVSEAIAGQSAQRGTGLLGSGESVSGAAPATGGAVPTAGAGGGYEGFGIDSGSGLETFESEVGPTGANSGSGGTPWFDVGAPSYAGYLGAGLEVANSIKNFDDVEANDKATYIQGHTALAAADIYTGGLASGAYGLIASTGPGKKAINALHKLDRAVNPVTIAANRLHLFKPSTKEMERKRWGGLMGDGVQNADIAYEANHPGGKTGRGVWESGKYAGQEWTFEKAKDLAKEDPSHFQLVFGNFDTFGNDWNTYSDAQQKEITRRLVAEDLYTPDYGDIVIKKKNQDRARAIKDEVLGGKPPAQILEPDAKNLPAPTPRGNGLLGTPGASIDPGFSRPPPAGLAQPQGPAPVVGMPRGNGLLGTPGSLNVSEELKKARPYRPLLGPR